MVNRFARLLLEGLFPNDCALCGLRSHNPLPLCRACEGELQVNSHACYQCAIPLAPGAGGPPGQRFCGNCLRAPPPFDRVIAPLIYSEQLALLIHHWKYRGETRLTPMLATLWLRRAPPAATVDAIIPVPLHWRRLWRRGFNQSELLARRLQSLDARLAGARLDTRSVRRRRATAAQSRIGAAQRSANLRGAFTVNRACANLRVAVVDDVLTTGATASAIAATLRRAGASRVEVWCLARTPAPGA
jgi:ComF family protein